MRTAAAECSRRPFRRWYGRGRPKPNWMLSLTIKHAAGEIVENIEFRAGDKIEAARKAFQRLQERLGGLLLEDWQNPRLEAKLSRQNGEGNNGGIFFILQTRCAHYLGALKAAKPSQMFKEIVGGRKNFSVRAEEAIDMIG